MGQDVMPPEKKVPYRQKRKITDDEWQRIRIPTRREELETKIKAIERQIAHIDRRVQKIRSPVFAAYIRCSHEDSKESGLGEAAQLTLCRRWAEFVRHEHPELPKDVKIYQEQDAVSAYKKDLRHRPAGRRLYLDLRNGDHVVFAYLDRAFRSTTDCLHTLRRFKRRGVTVHFANLRIDMNTPTGELVITIMAACAQMDSAIKSERIKAALRELRRLGRASNKSPPMGYRHTGRPGDGNRMVVPDLEQRAIMGEIVRVRDTYGWTWEKVAHYIEKWRSIREKRRVLHLGEKGYWGGERCSRAYKKELAIREGAKKAADKKDF